MGLKKIKNFCASKGKGHHQEKEDNSQNGRKHLQVTYSI